MLVEKHNLVLISLSSIRQRISEKNVVSIWLYICQMFGWKAQFGNGLSSNRQKDFRELEAQVSLYRSPDINKSS